MQPVVFTYHPGGCYPLSNPSVAIGVEIGSEIPIASPSGGTCEHMDYSKPANCLAVFSSSTP